MIPGPGLPLSERPSPESAPTWGDTSRRHARWPATIPRTTTLPQGRRRLKRRGKRETDRRTQLVGTGPTSAHRSSRLDGGRHHRSTSGDEDAERVTVRV